MSALHHRGSAAVSELTDGMTGDFYSHASGAPP
jgi:hypothetical protein